MWFKNIRVYTLEQAFEYTEEKLVGPGWKGVSERRTPQWIMNFITNPDPMIDKDPELQAQFRIMSSSYAKPKCI